jgi:hypothetical protein
LVDLFERLGLFDLEDEGTEFLRNVGKDLPVSLRSIPEDLTNRDLQRQDHV